MARRIGQQEPKQPAPAFRSGLWYVALGA